jgi:hypothetical protein
VILLPEFQVINILPQAKIEKSNIEFVNISVLFHEKNFDE